MSWIKGWGEVIKRSFRIDSSLVCEKIVESHVRRRFSAFRCQAEPPASAGGPCYEDANALAGSECLVGIVIALSVGNVSGIARESIVVAGLATKVNCSR